MLHFMNASKSKSKSKEVRSCRSHHRSSESTEQTNIDAKIIANGGCRLFDELAVNSTGPLLVADPLPPTVLLGGRLVSSPPAVALEKGADAAALLIATGAVFVFGGTWLVTCTLLVGVGSVSVATTTFCVASTGTTVSVLVLAAALPCSGCADCTWQNEMNCSNCGST